MSPPRRRLGAITALVLGVFLGLALLPLPVTGPLGRALGGALWNLLGLGAVCIPLLGIGLALAGFDRLGRLDMKRAAALMAGLSILVPYLIGAIARVTQGDLDRPTVLGRVTGWLPGFFALTIPDKVGVAGAVLLGFLALSALTLLTFAWHPLQRLERRPGEPGAGERAARPVATPEQRRHERETAEPQAPDDPEPEPLPRERPARPAPKAARPGKEPAGAPEAEDTLPPVDLLAPPRVQDADAGEAQLDRLGQSLLETLRTFKVDATIAGRTTGPVVTQFEVVPAPGVKAGRIMSLADDLAITMRAMSIRVAPIPGRGAVGVEVPNPVARMVTIRELIETPEWIRSRAALPIPLGRDLEGKPVIGDLARMPHLLIAGATGSGKSVAINTIITGLVYRYTPAELRLLMVDPKMVELSIYNALPHLRHPVVTNSHDAARVLKFGVLEMNRRYELLQANGARNLADFNRKVAEGKPLRLPGGAPRTLASVAAEPPDTPPPSEGEACTEGPLPLIVIVIDELADLMMTVQAEVETPLAMLAQKARAIGIHLLLATQRPSVNVLTGLIKANFPSRIAFRVASKVDSRTILDQNGAEALLGNGDMLFLPPGKSEPLRLQGAFIGTEETERVTGWFAARKLQREVARAEADILALVRADEAAAEGEGDDGTVREDERDSLFREAAEACIQNQGGSTSLLQRRLRIGYGRAARIIDQLEAAGILGAADGSKPREVRIGLGQLDEYTGA